MVKKKRRKPEEEDVRIPVSPELYELLRRAVIREKESPDVTEDDISHFVNTVAIDFVRYYKEIEKMDRLRKFRSLD